MCRLSCDSRRSLRLSSGPAPHKTGGAQCADSRATLVRLSSGRGRVGLRALSLPLPCVLSRVRRGRRRGRAPGRLHVWSHFVIANRR